METTGKADSPKDTASPKDAARAVHRALYPMRYHVPHKGQWRAHLVDARTVVITAGNRWGKSDFLTSEVAWASTGEHPVAGKYRVGTAASPFRVRIISSPENLAETIQPMLRSKLPAGGIYWSRRSSNGYDEYWLVRGSGWRAHIDFKSRNQEPGAFAGVGLDLLCADEPLPEAVYYEVRSRLSANDSLLRMIFVMTALEGCLWMEDVFFNSPDLTQPGKLIHLEGSTWDNCRCMLPDRHGLDCRCHGGHLKFSEIYDFEQELKRTDPLQYEARILGKRTFTARTIFPSFDVRVHCYAVDKMRGWKNGAPEFGTIYVTMDPHGARPDFIQYWCVDAGGSFWLLDEYPNYYEGQWRGEYYERIRARPVRMRNLAEEIIGRCKRFGLPIGGMGMDPHFGSQTLKDASETIVQQMNRAIKDTDENFPLFSLVQFNKDGDAEIKAGHKMINELLGYVDVRLAGESSEPDKSGLPRMFIGSHCENTIRAFRNYRMKSPSKAEGAATATDEPEELFKHAIDDVRYFLMMKPAYHPLPDRRRDRVSEPPSVFAA